MEISNFVVFVALVFPDFDQDAFGVEAVGRLVGLSACRLVGLSACRLVGLSACRLGGMVARRLG